MLSRSRLATATPAWSLAIQGGSEFLRMCGTWGRPYQSCREFRVLIDTSLINLVLSEIFYFCKVGTLELCLSKDGALELCPPKVGTLELCLSKVGALELCPPKVGT